jgi:uncharacterized protein (DUF433 family)
VAPSFRRYLSLISFIPYFVRRNTSTEAEQAKDRWNIGVALSSRGFDNLSKLCDNLGMQTAIAVPTQPRLKTRRKVIPTYDQHITITPGVRSGKPRIIGRRITVADVAMWYLRQSRSVDEIVNDFGLTHAQVHAALAYYYDHRTEIDAQEAEELAQADQLWSQYPSKLRTKVVDRG